MTMTAEFLAKALGGAPEGDGWKACCPAHDDRNPSLSIREDKRDGTVLVHCHAGCDQLDVLAALRELKLWGSNDGGKGQPRRRRRPRPRLPAEPRPLTEEEKAKRERALEIWEKSKPAPGTLVEIYLRARALTLEDGIPESLRFHPDLWHAGSRKRWPGMVALLVDLDGNPLGIQRTFLDHDGKGKAPVGKKNAKSSLGRIAGGGIHFGEPTDRLLVSEGTENCLTIMQVAGGIGWAGGSTSGMTGLHLPPSVKTVIILADNDGPGERTAQKSAKKWVAEGRDVRIATPPGQWNDYNDMLMAGVEI